MFNIGAFILPGVYNTISKLWLAQIDDKAVSVAETYNVGLLP
jgi:hypothetical protein